MLHPAAVDPVGLSSGQALGAFAVAALVVTTLYLLKLRRRRVEVAYLELWREVLTDARSSQLFARLTRWLSFLLALVLVGLLVAALADLRPREEGRTLHVLWIDASLSMQAEDAAPSRFSRAIERAHGYVDRLPEGDAAMVLAVTAHPSAEAIASEPAVLHRAIDAIRVTDGEADVARAASLALDAVLGRGAARLVIFSDGAFEVPAPLLARMREAMAMHAVALAGSALAGSALAGSGSGVAPGNLAITALAARPHPLDPSRAEVLLEVTSFADVAADVEIRLDTEGRAIEVLPLSIPARGRVRRFFTDITGLDRTLEAHLTVSGDASVDRLPADDHAYARIAQRTRTRVALVSRDNAYLEAALLLDEALEVTEVPPGSAPDPLTTDVAIFDGLLPAEPYPGPAIYLRPDGREGGASPLTVTGEAERPRFDVLEDEHPLLRWVALRNVNVARSLVLTLEDGDRAVAGDEGVPLLVAGARGDARFVALAFDVRDSDLPLRIAWPVLLLDAIGFLTPHEDRDPSFARAGVPFREALPAGATEAFLVSEPGSDAAELPVPVLDGQASLELAHAGIRTLRTDAGDRLIAVSPAAGPESELRALGGIDLGDGELSAPATPAPRPARHWWEWMALVALAILVIESITYHRRWTV